MTIEDGPPEGYEAPTSAWVVEYKDPRKPDGGSHQVGAFTSELEAEKMMRRLQAEGFFAPLRINLIPVHRTVEDWEWDR